MVWHHMVLPICYMNTSLVLGQWYDFPVTLKHPWMTWMINKAHQFAMNEDLHKITLSATTVWETIFLGHSPENRCPLYALYKIPLTWAIFYSPSLKCTRIGERVTVSFPHWRNLCAYIIRYTVLVFLWRHVIDRFKSLSPVLLVDAELGQQWLRQWLVAWWNQAITWTNDDLSSVRSSGTHLRALSSEYLKIQINQTKLKLYMVQVTEVQLSCYLVLLSVDRETR